MRHRSLVAHRRSSGRLLWVAAVLGLLALPVEYRGGAERPHAHAAYQLWYDAAHGSVAHHHRGDDHSGAAHAAVPAASGSAAVEAVGAAATDAPRLVGLSIGVTKVPLVATLLVLLAAPISASARVAWPGLPVLIGRSPPVASPPPRSLGAFA